MNKTDTLTKDKPVISFRPSKKNGDLITKLQRLAGRENRYLNNYIETVLLEHVNKREKKVVVRDTDLDM